MTVQSLNAKDDPFQPYEEEEEVLDSEVPYLSAIGSLMYLTNNRRPNIAFAINLFDRYIN